MKKDKLCLYHHLGLGDTIECNGMTRHFAEEYNQVDVFAKTSYYENVKYMYRDNKNIVVNEVDNLESSVGKFINNYIGDVIIAGFDNYFSNLNFFNKHEMGCGESFYYIAGVPWDFRNKKFYLLRDLEKEQEVFTKMNPLGEKYIFVHDDCSRGFSLNINTPYKIIKNDTSVNIFNLLTLLENAEEIHCMSSCILCLIDCIYPQVKFNNLFLHYNLRKVNLGPRGLFAKWNIIK